MPAAAIREWLQTDYWKIADLKMLGFFRHPSALAPACSAPLAALSLATRHFWCRYLCPYGALLGLLSLASRQGAARRGAVHALRALHEELPGAAAGRTPRTRALPGVPGLPDLRQPLPGAGRARRRRCPAAGGAAGALRGAGGGRVLGGDRGGEAHRPLGGGGEPGRIPADRSGMACRPPLRRGRGERPPRPLEPRRLAEAVRLAGRAAALRAEYAAPLTSSRTCSISSRLTSLHRCCRTVLESLQSPMARLPGRPLRRSRCLPALTSRPCGRAWRCARCAGCPCRTCASRRTRRRRRRRRRHRRRRDRGSRSRPETAAAEAAARLARPGLVHDHLAAVELELVEALDRLRPLRRGLHLDERESARLSRELVRHHLAAADCAHLLEERADVRRRCREGEVSHVQFHAFPFLSVAVRRRVSRS